MSKDVAASIREGLLQLAKERGDSFDFVLTQYAIQRLLYRLSISPYKDQFLLKGAWLFSIWSNEAHRPTKDADFLGIGDNDVGALVAKFSEICNQTLDDGIEFDIASFKGEEIKEDAVYQGVRITGYAYLANARIAIQLDIGFGDAVTPKPVMAEIPVLLDLPAPQLIVYPVYTVIAEKFQAMVALGIANSRMKDFYDIWRIAGMMPLDGELLSQAIRATFAQRGTPISGDVPLIFTEEFSADANKRSQWKAFLSKNGLAGNDFDRVVAELLMLVRPVYNAIVAGNDLHQSWVPEQWKWNDK